MIEGFPYTEFPSGWYQIAWSSQIADQQTVPLEYFERELVAYRGASGAVHVMDAHCRHMGAHLGYGGAVEGEDIRCPFHGWCWGPDGEVVAQGVRNTRIPYGARPSLNIRMRTYPVVEQDGIVLMWFDPAGEPPSWQPPKFTADCPGVTFFDLLPDCAGGDRLRIQPQMMAENTVDFPHLIWTHRWTGGESELVRYGADGHRFVATMSGYLPTKQGTVKLEVTENLYGLGLIVAPLQGIRLVLNVASVTPINHDDSFVFMNTFVSCPEGADPSQPDKLALAMATAQRQEVIGHGDKGDRKIWEHQRYVQRPPMVPEEAAGIIAVRKWARQFYAEPAVVRS